MIASPGLGAGGNQIVGAVGGGVGTGISVLTPLLFGATAGPIGLAVGGIVAAASAIASAIGVGSGCGPDCVKATQIVNQAEPVFQSNLVAYENGQLDQSTAKSNANSLWLAIEQACAGVPGGAGQNCIGDRQVGACKWKQTANPSYPGQPQMGDCWNWQNAYIDPLDYPPVNAPSGGSLIGGISPTLLIAGGLIAIGLFAD